MDARPGGRVLALVAVARGAGDVVGRRTVRWPGYVIGPASTVAAGRNE